MSNWKVRAVVREWTNLHSYGVSSLTRACRALRLESDVGSRAKAWAKRLLSICGKREACPG